MFAEIGRTLIFLGLLLITVGLILNVAPGLRLGRLPGDVHIQKENWNLYIPITTCVILSVILSLVLWIISLLRR